jgi:hypothetical protein
VACASLAGQTQALNPAQFFLLAEQSRTAFTVQGAGARAAGTGGAFIAVADDATAVSFNPAGLAQLLRPEVSVVGQGTTRDLNLTGFQSLNATQSTAFTDADNRSSHQAPTFASFAVPWKRDGLNCTFLVSYQRLFDFTYAGAVAYQGMASGGATVSDVTQRVGQTGGIDLWSVGFGAELTSRILLGVSVNRWSGRSGFNYTSTSVTSGVGVPFDSELSQSSSFHGLNANVGLIWRSQLLNIGAVYRTPFTASYGFSNRFAYTDPTTFVPTVEAADASTRVNWPETLGWGLGFHPGSRFLLTADSSHTPWSRTTYSASGTGYDGLNWFDFQNPTAIRDTTDYHVGTEWIAWAGERLVIPLRAGAFREPQPVVDVNTGTQRVLQGLTAGFGVKFRDFTVDVAVRTAHDRRYVSRYSTDAPVGGVSATAHGYEGLNERSLLVSLIYQLDAAGVKKVLAWVFVGGGDGS